MKYILFYLTLIKLVILKIKHYGNNGIYLQFFFQRNLTYSRDLKKEDIFKNIFYNQIYINMTLGIYEIPFYLYLQKNPTAVESSNAKFPNVKGIYNELKSPEYKSINNKESIILDDIAEFVLSTDNIKELNNKLKFDLVYDNDIKTHITEGGKIGFKLSIMHQEFENTNFILNIKSLNLISNYYFSILYDKDKEDRGTLIIGEPPDTLIPKYKREYFTKTYADNINNNIEWFWRINEIKINSELFKMNCFSYFYYELGYIIPSSDFADYLKKTEFYMQIIGNTNKCTKITFNINDFDAGDIEDKLNGDYYGFYCNKNIDISLFPTINLNKKGIDYIFNITGNDVFELKNNLYYFMIVFQDNIINTNWYFGKPFFKKFPIVFNYQSKEIGVYTKEINEDSKENNSSENKENKQKNLKLYLVISALIIVVIVLLIIIVICYKKFPRKNKANEMEDDYEYKINSDEENKVLN